MRMNHRIEKLEQQVNPNEETIIITIVHEGMPKDWIDSCRDEVNRQIEEITEELGHKLEIVVVDLKECYETGEKPIIKVPGEKV